MKGKEQASEQETKEILKSLKCSANCSCQEMLVLGLPFSVPDTPWFVPWTASYTDTSKVPISLLSSNRTCDRHSYHTAAPNDLARNPRFALKLVITVAKGFERNQLPNAQMRVRFSCAMSFQFPRGHRAIPPKRLNLLNIPYLAR